MKKIMFVCLGNICRSPMAEFIFKDLVKKEGLAEKFIIQSSATSSEEVGNGIYPPAKKELEQHNIKCDLKKSVQLKKSDALNFDFFICMDNSNVKNTERILGIENKGKIFKLLSFAGSQDDVSDPWYTGNFKTAYNDIFKGCTALLENLKKDLI